MRINKGELLKKVQETYLKKDLPKLRPGDIVRVHQKIKEGDKEREQIFEGMVIGIRKWNTTDASFIVRKTYPGEMAVEKVFPLHSPLVLKIEVLKRHKVRRAKLYYMRERYGKKLRLKEIEIKD